MKNLKEESSEMFSEPSRDYEKKDFLKKKAKGKESNDIVSDHPTLPAVKRKKAKGKESNDIVSDHPTLPAVKRSGAKALA
ncbi:hypothetical protein RND71_023445 [Anisodus tanguticus]|uniref:Uncharacterized protein n=1 Tax=Anisodus tanguticus TaxID=243964 RepID=A0AAE1VER9_9SOLA|nr:hypothetical protein RND71_023445 [Anisodus tanguticus]